jgi:acyl-CoA thioesterase-2
MTTRESEAGVQERSREDAPPVALGARIEVEQVGEGRFRSPGGPGGRSRTFGGAVAAQALLAAGRTVDAGRSPHSVHGHFLRPGDAAAPTEYRVTAVRDGAAYSTREVVAEQRGRTTFALTASFHVPEDGWEHQFPRLDAPEPEDLPPLEEAIAGAAAPVRDWIARLPHRHAFDLRFVDDPARAAAERGPGAPRQRFWLRSRTPLPDDPLLHRCAVAYASDMLLLSTSLAPHPSALTVDGVTAASLDHAVWFHAAARADDWLFYDQDSSWAGGGRALCHGRVFDRAGGLVATVAQEAMIRRRGPAQR